MADHLIACVLGGSAPGAKTELHDVAFAIGNSVDLIHEQLLESWFGEPHGLHIDAWVILDTVDGHRVRLQPTASDNGLSLYFINLGGYRAGEFGERHAWWFFVAPSKAEAKARARQSLLQDCEQIHKDDLHDVDDCLQVSTVAGWHIHLDADPDAAAPKVSNGYWPLPASTIKAWTERHDPR
ncbi:MAG: DUF1543 domain-containing protein [Rhodanobacteraceae bacterium]